MSAKDPQQGIEFRQSLSAEAANGLVPPEAGLSAIRRLSVVALVGVVLVLVLAPALIAGVSMVGGRMVDQAPGWFRWAIALAPYVKLGSLGSTIALLGGVLRTREDQ